MHITVVAFGTQGDVQPMVALGKGLQAAGHQVQLIAGENSVAWVKSHGLECIGTIDMQALMQSEEGREWFHNPRKQISMMKALLRQHRDGMLAPLTEIAPHTDLMISGFTSEPFVHSIREKFGTRQISVPLQPYQPTRSAAASLLPLWAKGDSILNLWVGRIFEYMIWGVSAETANYQREKLGLAPYNARGYVRASRGIPTIFGFSPHVVPPPPDWSANVQIAGYLFLDAPQDYQPPTALVDFLAAGEKPVYIGFGSMPSHDPDATFRMFCDALQRAGKRGVLITGWSGAKQMRLPAHVLVLDSVPHGWLFPRVAGVVHHGGAGTTAAGLRAGVPSLLIPHAADQPYWARRTRELGVSAPPIPRKKLTTERLADGIRTMVSEPSIRESAAKLGEAIRAENGVAAAVALIERATKR